MLAIGGLLYEARNLATAIERPWLERDIKRAYDAIPYRYEYDQLKLWCGLRQTPATAQEIAAIREALQAPLQAQQVWCSPYTRLEFDTEPRRIRPPHPDKWIRLQDPADTERWIGIGLSYGWTKQALDRLSRRYGLLMCR